MSIFSVDLLAIARQHALKDHAICLAWAVAMACMIAFARTAPYVGTLLIAMTVVLVAGERSSLSQQVARLSAFQIVLLAGACLVLVSCLWAISPSTALKAGGFSLVAVLGGLLIVERVSAQSESWRAYFMFSLLMGYLAGVAILLIELLFNAPLSVMALNIVDRFSRVEGRYYDRKGGAGIGGVDLELFNRSAVVAVLMVWPMLLGMSRIVAGRARVAFASAIIVATLAIAHLSFSGTALLALLCSIAALGIAWFRTGAALAVIAAAWVVATVATFPVIDRFVWFEGQAALPRTAKARIVIWHRAAVAAKRHPILGIGANNSRHYTGLSFMPPYLNDLGKRRADYTELSEPLEKGGNTHPHNAFLQIWLELGVLGAAAATAIGLAAVGAMRRWDPTSTTAGVGLFVSTTITLAIGFSLWQTWMLTSIMIAAGMLAWLSKTKVPSTTPSAPIA